MTSNIDCPSCGAPIDYDKRFQEYIDCPYCGAHSYVGEATRALAADAPAQGADAHATLADVYSRFETGATGSCDWGQGQKMFTVEGRLQYEYEGGYWSEWYLNVEGVGYWLQEDEGLYVMFIELPVETPEKLEDLYYTHRDNLDQLPMGRRMPILNSQMGDWQLTECGAAILLGSEGDVPITQPPGHKITYFDGCGGGYRYTIELWSEGREGSVHQGWPLEYEQIKMDTERNHAQGTIGSMESPWE